MTPRADEEEPCVVTEDDTGIGYVVNRVALHPDARATQDAATAERTALDPETRAHVEDVERRWKRKLVNGLDA